MERCRKQVLTDRSKYSEAPGIRRSMLWFMEQTYCLEQQSGGMYNREQLYMHIFVGGEG